MKSFNNEKGMALVTVLLMITVFSILGMAVISLSISNTKQVTKTEEEMQAVDLAEMGVVYYKNAFIPNANNQLGLAIETAKKAINRKNEEIQKINETKENEEKIPLLALDDPKNILEFMPDSFWSQESLLPQNIVPKTITLDENNSFIIDSHELVDIINHKVQVDFNSIGYGAKDIKEITGTIRLDINEELIEAYLNESGTSSDTGKTIAVMTISRPEDFESCNYISKLENGDNGKGCSYNDTITDYEYDIIDIKAIVDGEKFSLKTGNITISNSFLYINKSGDFNNLNGDGINNSDLYIGGNGEFGNINQLGISDSKLDIRGDATFKKNIQGGINNATTIYVGKTLTFEGQVGNINDSTIFVKENLNFNKHLGTINNSKICVGGKITGISQTPDQNWFEDGFSCMRFGNISGNTPSNSSDLSDEIANQVDQLTLKYH